MVIRSSQAHAHWPKHSERNDVSIEDSISAKTKTNGKMLLRVWSLAHRYLGQYGSTRAEPCSPCLVAKLTRYTSIVSSQSKIEQLHLDVPREPGRKDIAHLVSFILVCSRPRAAGIFSMAQMLGVEFGASPSKMALGLLRQWLNSSQTSRCCRD
ncbi:hypothetical protein BC835DRAFT_132384 [Cytidiella melzeri]|nr:hypothetical protein BC835DRAFT_132384 [Cytidiella melzeri]